jgi:hypothetical protein
MVMRTLATVDNGVGNDGDDADYKWVTQLRLPTTVPMTETMPTIMVIHERPVIADDSAGNVTETIIDHNGDT